MSAIAAIYNLDGKPVDRESMSRMSDALAHRGMDAHGEVALGNIGLVHRMRHTTPESLDERLPLRDASGLISITCDARIDNRDELASQLSLDSSIANKLTDSEFILAAYEKWGNDCPSKLIGDFVFVIWDERQKKLFAARDALGLKHFYYYYRADKLFALASEPKALFELSGIDRKLDETCLGDFLVLNSEDKEGTLFKGITRLPSTHAMEVSERYLKTWQYWRPSPDEIKLKNSGEYQEAFREKLTLAVSSRLRSAFPVGAFLSGGLDSSSIVCLASRELTGNRKPPLQTFSAIFPSVAKIDPRIDELRYIQSVLRETDCDANFIEADKGNPLAFMEKIFWHAEHPVGAPNAYMDCEIYTAAQKKDVRVLLSGLDGDSTVGYGYDDFARMAERGMFLRLFRDSVSLSKNMPERRHGFKRTFWHRGIKKALAPLVADLRRSSAKPSNQARPVKVSFPKHLAAVRPSVRERLRIEERSSYFYDRNFPSGESPAELHFRGLTSGHFSLTLELLEKISAGFGIEARYPFFDRRLIEFCIGLPPGERTYNGWTRSILRHAMKGILPDDVRWRTDKSNIGASVKVNLVKHGYGQLDEAININTDPLARYVEVKVLQDSLKEYTRSPMDTERDALLVLSNVYLSNWLRFVNFA
jgi:asparagine synthase (glutamine-hydrolysing)